MASDLSKLIRDSFTLTLNGLLAKDAKILNITKAHPYDIEDTQLLQVQSTFDFSNFTSKFTYLVPAKSASLIFNTMMGSPITDLSEEIDDDAEDAISEFVSNTCGGLTTAINGAGFEDVGQTKFNISHKEILNGNDITDLETTFRFEIDLEDNELILYMAFDEPILTHITEIMSSQITFHEERKVKEEEPEATETQSEIVEEKKEEETNIKDTTQEEKNENEDIDPKTKKLKLLIMIVGGVLGLIIVVFLVLYFMGTFDSEAPKEIPMENNATKMKMDAQKVDVVKYTTLKKVDFKISDIDKNRLNRQLEELTKYKVLNKEELEAQKLAEKNRLFELEREKELLEFSKKNHEEPLFEKKELEKKIEVDKKTKFKKETFTEEKDPVVVVDNNITVDNTKMVEKAVVIDTPVIEKKNLYAVTDSLKYSLFKKIVQETKTTQARISICNDKSGKTTIYIGPFENKELQNKMIELTNSQNKDINIVKENITEEDFSSRCNLE